MIRPDMTPSKYRICFADDGVERCHYSDDRRHYEQLVARHGHFSDLRIEPVVLTVEQQQRLSEISSSGLDVHDASIYVRYGTTESKGTGYYDPGKLVAYWRDQVEPDIKAQRKAAEARGVMHNGIRYHGDPGNRQAMQEALAAARDAELEKFVAWKDSDGNYHSEHPVAEVEAALRKIALRRAVMISLESQYVAQVAAGEIDIMSLDWTTNHDGMDSP